MTPGGRDGPTPSFGLVLLSPEPGGVPLSPGTSVVLSSPGPGVVTVSPGASVLQTPQASLHCESIKAVFFLHSVVLAHSGHSL